MRILYDSKNENFKTPFGCVRQNEQCTMTIHIPDICGAVSAYICINDEDGFYMEAPMELSGACQPYTFYTGSFALKDCGLYFYCFRINTQNSSFLLYKQDEIHTNMEVGHKWQLTCFSEDYDTPDWYKGCVMYQIFPDRFYRLGLCDASDKLRPYWVHHDTDDVPHFLPDGNGEILNNDFFGGNLRGIKEKLGYLKELGVSVIYLNPIFMAFSNHRYDTADYKRIDPLLGTEQDFADLCDAAHNAGIRILLDGVFSHTGSNSIYFDKEKIFNTGAVSNENSPYKDWFIFERYPDKYNCWWGIKTLPCVDECNQSYIDYIIDSEDSVVAHWMRLGADGFRLDVADELPDAFIKRLHNRVKGLNPEGLVLGEVWEDASNKQSYGKRRRYFADSELDSVMNYPFKEAIIDFILKKITAQGLADCVMTIAENYPKPVLDCLMNSLSTHDTPRILTVLGAEDKQMTKIQKARYKLSEDAYRTAIERQKAAAFLQFVLPGSGCIYYGDEIGMEGFEDPLNRGYFKWNGQDEELLGFYKQITALKLNHMPLKQGDIKVIISDNGVFGITRQWQDEAVTAVVNVGSAAVALPAGNVIIGEKINGSVIGKYGFALMEGAPEF